MANVCCDGADLPWPLNKLRHCEIAFGECPKDRSYISYPISIDTSEDRKMDNGKSCKCAKEQDIQSCIKRNPYSPGKGLPGSNCQTSVIKTLANCCMKSTWRPNPYGGNPRGPCIKYSYYNICIEWSYPEWRE